MRLALSALLIAAGIYMPICSLPVAQAEDAESSAPMVLKRDLGIERDTPEIPSVVVPAGAMAAPAPSPVVMDLTSPPASVWTRIRNGFGLPDISTPLVHEQEGWYSKRPDYIKRTVARSSRYLYYIVSEVERRGMPSEIALLPIIESAYNPVAYSRAHASGIWQFIPSTGKNYGLQQNFWYDGRRDVMAATAAALDYLEKLYEMFGSWDLALAAYNWGENAVSRAIAKNSVKGLATDYQSLSMPNETRYYIPKLQAIKNIIANPAQYNLELEDIPNRPYFVAVTTTKHIDVKLAAKLADVSLEEFISLNPGYSRPVIRANSEQRLLLPADKAELFRANLENHDQPLVSWQAYTLKSGDNLERVAGRHNITIAQLKQVNGINARRRIGPGSTLLVPVNGTATPHLPDLPAPPINVARAPKKSGKHTHVARKSGKIVHSKKAVKKTASRSSAKTLVLAQKTR
jgi:membrane-bound lytic murein transglycosylase D